MNDDALPDLPPLPPKWSDPSYLARTAARELTQVVSALELPPILGHEPRAAGLQETIKVGPDISLRLGGALYYDENGYPLAEQDSTAALHRINAIREAPGGEIGKILHSKRGVTIHVTTAYLGVDLSDNGNLPLVWETLVFIGEGVSKMLDPIRYATRAAAHSGHRAVIAAVWEAVRHADGW